MAYRRVGLRDMLLTVQGPDNVDLISGSGETDTETTGWFHGSEVWDDIANVMTGPTPTAAQIAAGMPGSGFSIGNWIQQNKATVYAGAALLTAMALFSGGGRRR